MATENIESDQSVFDQIESEIVNAFSLIIEQTKKRRDELLTQLNQLRIQFQEKILLQPQITGLKELEQMRAQLMEMNLKQNFLLKVQEASLAPIEQQINDLKEKSVSEPLLRFECPLTEMLDKMETLGAIINEQVNVSVNVKQSNEQRFDYPQRILAKRRIGKQGTGDGQFQNPLRMHVTDNGLLYVVDRDNKRVQVFDVESETFLLHFGQSQFTLPNGITTRNEYCYVTDFTQNKIFQFLIEDYSLVKTQGAGGSNKKLNHPTAITISEDDLLYVTDSSNHRVCVYDTNLKYVSELGVGMLVNPKDVKIYFSEILILDERTPCLHTFDKSGIHLLSILTYGKGKQLSGASSFYLDVNRNIIVSDLRSQTLKIFSTEGELLHRIGKEAPNTEKVGFCFGVVMFKQDILISCLDPFHCIKIF